MAKDNSDSLGLRRHTSHLRQAARKTSRDLCFKNSIFRACWDMLGPDWWIRCREGTYPMPWGMLPLEALPCVCLSFQLLHLAGTTAVGFQCVLRDGASRAWGMVLVSLASSSLTHLPEKEQNIEIAEKGPVVPHSGSLPVLSDHLTSFPFPQASPGVWGGHTDLPGHAPSY